MKQELRRGFPTTLANCITSKKRPNHFVLLNNRCFRMLSANYYGHNYATCTYFDAFLFTPTTKEDYLVLKQLMEMYSYSQVFAGVKKDVNSETWYSLSGVPLYNIEWDESHHHVDYDAKNLLIAYIHEANLKKWRMSMDVDMSLPAICEYSTYF